MRYEFVSDILQSIDIDIILEIQLVYLKLSILFIYAVDNFRREFFLLNSGQLRNKKAKYSICFLRHIIYVCQREVITY